MTDIEILSKNFKKFRKLKGLSQDDVAKKLNFSRRTWVNYETGFTYPDLDTLLNFARICNIHPAQLFLDADEVISKYSYKFRDKSIDFDLNEIGEKIQNIQVRTGCTIMQIAENTGVNEERLYDIIEGEAPTDKELVKLMRWIDAPLEWFTGKQ